jgi:hypothetical protein
VSSRSQLPKPMPCFPPRVHQVPIRPITMPLTLAPVPLCPVTACPIPLSPLPATPVLFPPPSRLQVQTTVNRAHSVTTALSTCLHPFSAKQANTYSHPPGRTHFMHGLSPLVTTTQTASQTACTVCFSGSYSISSAATRGDIRPSGTFSPSNNSISRTNSVPPLVKSVLPTLMPTSLEAPLASTAAQVQCPP